MLTPFNSTWYVLLIYTYRTVEFECDYSCCVMTPIRLCESQLLLPWLFLLVVSLKFGEAVFCLAVHALVLIEAVFCLLGCSCFGHHRSSFFCLVRVLILILETSKLSFYSSAVVRNSICWLPCCGAASFAPRALLSRTALAHNTEAWPGLAKLPTVN